MSRRPRLTRRVQVSWLELVAARVTWTQIIGAGAVLTGALLAITGMTVVPYAPAFGRIPGWPVLYGMVLAVAGIAVSIATVKRLHGWATVSALAAAAVYALMALGFLTSWTGYPDGTPSRPAIPPYPIGAYLTLMSVHVVHAVVEAKAWRRGRILERGEPAIRAIIAAGRES